MPIQSIPYASVGSSALRGREKSAAFRKFRGRGEQRERYLRRRCYERNTRPLLLGLRALWSEREGRENALAPLLPALVLYLFLTVVATLGGDSTIYRPDRELGGPHSLHFCLRPMRSVFQSLGCILRQGVRFPHAGVIASARLPERIPETPDAQITTLAELPDIILACSGSPKQSRSAG